jgi:hypothetical protein
LAEYEAEEMKAMEKLDSVFVVDSIEVQERIDKNQSERDLSRELLGAR